MPTQTIDSLRILCFGDSLTAGYTHYGLEHYPYSDFLGTTLKKFLPSTKIRIDTAGLSADRVKAGSFLRRIESKCAKAAADPYDWVIVLGGTNDLGWGESAVEVFEALSTFISIILSFNPSEIAP